MWNCASNPEMGVEGEKVMFFLNSVDDNEGVLVKH
jgi:hypothetical protein